MINNKINIFSRIAIVFLSLSLSVINCASAPVLCFEADGHVNIESNCDSDCDIPKEDNHNDDCGECVDIPLLNFVSNTPIILTSTNADFGFEILNSVNNYFYIFQHNSSVFQTQEFQQTPFPPFLKNTILLI